MTSTQRDTCAQLRPVPAVERTGLAAPSLRILAALALATGLGACSDSSDSPPEAGPAADVVGFSATLHRSEGGIPHIVAEDWASLGYGTAYAVAQDHYCEQARNILKFRAELSENFGSAGGNLNSDIFYQLMIDTGLYDAQIDPEFDALFTGYAAGFNRYTREQGDAVTDPACAGADWIPEVTAEDIRRIHLTPAFLPNVGFLMALATPPATVASTEDAPAKQRPAAAERRAADEALGMRVAQLMTDINRDRGSNGVAIGGDLSSTGSGLLYTNPHLDWDDFGFRMYGLHQIIPGVTNMLGANQAQRANVGFGTNGQVAWTNTVSAGIFFSFFELELVAGNPTQYLFDGEVRDLEAQTVTIQIVDANGVVSDHQHTFYRSHLGWLVGGALPWTETTAYAVSPADEGARGFQGGALAMSRATNVRELKAAIDRYGNTPSINTIAADSSGEVLYGDLAPAPGLSDAQLDACATSSSGQLIRGNSSDCEWQTDDDSAAPGLLGASKQPFIFRRDYVTNSNDSAWLANPKAPITGYPRIKGDIGTERTLRTRTVLNHMRERENGSDGLPGNTFDLDSLGERMLSNETMAVHVLRDGLVQLCRDNPEVELESATVDMAQACEVLAAWDGAYNVNSRGAHLFREFLRNVRSTEDGRGAVPGAIDVLTPFDPDNAVATPAGLDSSENDAALQALAAAVSFWQDAGVDLDAPLGDLQSVTLAGQRIPLHGADEFEGVANKMGLPLSGAAYPAVSDSSASWVMVTEVAGDQTRVRGLSAYSQSSDPTSPRYSDLTLRFSEKDLPDIPFLLADVETQAVSTVALTEGSADCAGNGWQAFSGVGVDDENSCRAYFESVYDRRLTDFVDD